MEEAMVETVGIPISLAMLRRLLDGETVIPNLRFAGEPPEGTEVHLRLEVDAFSRTCLQYALDGRPDGWRREKKGARARDAAAVRDVLETKKREDASDGGD